MARLPALISAFEKVDGRDLSVVRQFARVIREAGLMTTEKRGKGAAAMSERDAVNLLLGLCSGDSAAAAPAAVRQLRKLVPHLPEMRMNAKAPASLAAVLSAPSLGEAIEVLISSFPEVLATLDFLQATLSLEVRLASAAIVIDRATDSAEVVRQTFVVHADHLFDLTGQVGRRSDSDRQVTVRVGLRTFREIAMCLADENAGELAVLE